MVRNTERKEEIGIEALETLTGGRADFRLDSESLVGPRSLGIEGSPHVIFENFIWLNTKDTAEYLRTTPRQIRKWVYQGRIKAYKLLGKSLRFKKSELDSLLKGESTWE